MHFADIEFIIKNIYGIVVQSREKKIAQLLTRNALKLATVESCTGGLISSRMTDVSGSSVYNKEISKEESKKIYSIVSRLASGKTTFGDIAYDAKGIIKSVKDDFVIVERKSDFVYIAIKAIVTIVIKK